MKYVLIILIWLLFLPQKLVAQISDKPDPLITESLFSPSNFYVLNDSLSIISDPDIEFPVYLVNMKKDSIVTKIRVGKGPAELSPRYKEVSITNEYIFIWDFGSQILKYYDYGLNYIGSKAFNNLGFLFSVKVGEDYVYTIGQGKDFIMVYNYSNENIIGEKETVISISDSKYFTQFNELTIRQHFKSTIHNHNLIVANHFTSLLFSVDESGLNFTNLEPFNVDQTDDSSDYVNNPVANPLCAFDIETNGQDIHVLSKGEKMDESKLNEAFENNTQNILLNEFKHTKNLLLYNQTGDYINKIHLPVAVKKIEFFKDKIYYLRTMDGEPIINVIKKEKLFK